MRFGLADSMVRVKVLETAMELLINEARSLLGE